MKGWTKRLDGTAGTSGETAAGAAGAGGDAGAGGETGAGGKLAPMRLGGFNVRSKDWTSAERIYGKPCECRGYPQASFAGAQTVHIGLKGIGRARECASMGA